MCVLRVCVWMRVWCVGGVCLLCVCVRNPTTVPAASLHREADKFAYDHQDFLIIFAMGNDGPGKSSGRAPGVTFKNGIAVGASLNTDKDELVDFSGRCVE